MIYVKIESCANNLCVWFIVFGVWDIHLKKEQAGSVQGGGGRGEAGGWGGGGGAKKKKKKKYIYIFFPPPPPTLRPPLSYSH